MAHRYPPSSQLVRKGLFKIASESELGALLQKNIAQLFFWLHEGRAPIEEQPSESQVITNNNTLRTFTRAKDY